MTSRFAWRELDALRARFHAARGNAPALEVLNDELRGLTADAAVDLQCEVMAALRMLRAGKAPSPIKSTANNTTPQGGGSQDVLQGIFADIGESGPDGRALYRYGVSDARFAELSERIGYLHRRGNLEQANPRSAATFVLYVAEWFRREYEGGGYKWESPAPEIIGSLSDAARKQLARDGLGWWGRTPRRTDHGELRLMSLALEGGFPTRLLESREQGRIAVHLRTLVVRVEALAEATEDRAIEISEAISAGLGSYNNDEFHALCADLALAIVALKITARAAPPGVAASAWLDGMKPSWRDQLPIRLAGDGARRLLEDLVSARAERFGDGDAESQRLLVRSGGDWSSALRLVMDGEVRFKGLDLNPSEGRLRVHAAGALSSAFASELAMIEPPTESDDGWLCRARAGASVVALFPFGSPVEVELRTGDRSRGPVIWPKGEPLRSELLIFADERGDDEASPPTHLIHIGAGSLRTRRRRIYLLAPADFEVTPLQSGPALTPIWRGTQLLFETTASVHAGSKEGDRYRVEVGCEGERAEQLVLEGAQFRGAQTVDRALILYAGRPSLRTRSGGRTDAPRGGQVRWRAHESPVWRDWVAQPPRDDVGRLEVVWRDPQSQALRDRQRFVILPQGARLLARPATDQGVRYTPEEMPGWTLAVSPSDGVKGASSAHDLLVRFEGKPRRQVSLSLRGPGTQSVAIVARAPLAGGGFARGDGSMFPNRARVMLDDLRGAVVFAEGRERLYMRGSAGGSRTIAFSEELGLWSISEEIARLLSANSGLEDTVTLELGSLNGRTLTVGRYAANLTIEGRSVTAKIDAALDDVSAVHAIEWLPICRPVPRLLAERSWTERTSRRIETLPDDLVGPGLVLLRQDGRLIGRPTLTVGSIAESLDGFGDLQLAGLIRDSQDRLGSMHEALGRLGDPTEKAELDRSYLLSLISALRDVPPSAIDVFKAFAHSPSAQANLVVSAPDEVSLARVWGFERDLPFMWALVPVRVWVEAFEGRRVRLESLMTASGLDSVAAARIACQTVRQRAEACADLDPLLRAPLSLAGQCSPANPPPPPLLEGAQDRIRRTADLTDEPRRRPEKLPADPATVSYFRRIDSPVRDQLPDFHRFDPSQWEGLDAPCASALAAAEMAKLTPSQVLRIRDKRAEEPLSFADLYAESLRRLARGQPLEC